MGGGVVMMQNGAGSEGGDICAVGDRRCFMRMK